MKIKTDFAGYYGPGIEFKYGSINQLEPANSARTNSVKQSLIGTPNFKAVFQRVNFSPWKFSNDPFELTFEESYKNLVKLARERGDNVHPDLIQIGYEQGFPQELIGGYFGEDCTKANLSRILVAPISELPRENGEKDVEKTIGYVQALNSFLKEEDETSIRRVSKELIDHLHSQRQKFGLTAFEGILYRSLNQKYGNRVIMTDFGLSAIEDIVLNTLGNIFHK